MKPRWKQKGTIEGMKERQRVNPRDRKLKARESDQRADSSNRKNSFMSAK